MHSFLQGITKHLHCGKPRLVVLLFAVVRFSSLAAGKNESRGTVRKRRDRSKHKGVRCKPQSLLQRSDLSDLSAPLRHPKFAARTETTNQYRKALLSSRSRSMSGTFGKGQGPQMRRLPKTVHTLLLLFSSKLVSWVANVFHLLQGVPVDLLTERHSRGPRSKRPNGFNRFVCFRTVRVECSSVGNRGVAGFGGGISEVCL